MVKRRTGSLECTHKSAEIEENNQKTLKCRNAKKIIIEDTKWNKKWI